MASKRTMWTQVTHVPVTRTTTTMMRGLIHHASSPLTYPTTAKPAPKTRCATTAAHHLV